MIRPNDFPAAQHIRQKTMQHFFVVQLATFVEFPHFLRHLYKDSAAR